MLATDYAPARNPNRPMAGELVDPMRSMEESDSFALLLSHEYTQNRIESLGSQALKGVDRARFCALEEADAALSDGKKLEFVIAKLYHHVSFYGNYGSIGDWDEDGRDETIIVLAIPQRGGHLSAGDKLPVKLNFLNPEQETRAQLWMKPYGSSDMHGYLGNEGPSKESRYNRYAIVAWSKAGQVENMLKFMDVKDALAALQSTAALDDPTFRKFMEVASVKVAQVAEVMAKQELIHYKKHCAVSPKLGFTVCKLLETFGDPALVNLFFQAFFKRMDEKASIDFSIATILKMFHWSVGDSLLDALSSDEHHSLKRTVKFAQKPENGPAKRGLLKYAVERALTIEDEDLSWSNSIEDLWKLVLYDADEHLLTRLSNKFNRMSPRFFRSTIRAFSDLWRDPNISTLKKAVMVSIAVSRSEWLERQIHVLEQPFTWKMPVAELPGNAQVEAFLRGSSSTLTTPGVLSSEKFGEADRYRCRSWNINASFSTKAGGAGSGAFFTISKTRQWYDDNKDKIPRLKEELKKLKTATVETLVAVVSESRKK